MIPVFLLATGFIILRYTNKEKDKSESFYQLQKRKAVNSNNKEWMAMYKQAEAHLDKLRLEPKNNKSKLALATIFINEARAWGNHAYYDAAATHYIDEILATEPKNFEASVMKSLVLLSQHRFEEASAQAEATRQINPYNSFVYGVLVDANVELGNYTKAIEYADQMTSIRPDLRSYSRIAYLREIHGDNPGAIEAMKMAATAGIAGDEATAWARVQLAHLYENTGQFAQALQQYDITLADRPDYAYAIGGKGNLMLNDNKPDEAIVLFKQADGFVEDVMFKEGLAKAYRLKGDEEKATKLNKAAIKAINDHQHFASTDEKSHYHAGMELAYAFLADNNLKEAMNAAEVEYKRRPANIDVNECMAWVLYKNKKPAEALSFINNALSTNSQNPRLLCRAAVIYNANNLTEKAITLKSTALAAKPLLDSELITACNRF